MDRACEGVIGLRGGGVADEIHTQLQCNLLHVDNLAQRDDTLQQNAWRCGIIGRLLNTGGRLSAWHNERLGGGGSLGSEQASQMNSTQDVALLQYFSILSEDIAPYCTGFVHRKIILHCHSRRD